MPLLLFVLFMISIIVAIIIYDIYNMGSHVRYKTEELNPNAQVVDVQCKTVGSKGQRKYRTIVIFEDGFQYISHDTERKDQLFMYTISMKPEMRQDIIKEAVKKHNEVCEKKLRIADDSKQRLFAAYERLSNNEINTIKSDDISLMINDFIKRGNEFVGNRGKVYTMKFIDNNQYYGSLKNGFLLMSPESKKIHIFKINQMNHYLMDFTIGEKMKVYYINGEIGEREANSLIVEANPKEETTYSIRFDEKVERIQKLSEMKKSGLITEDEYLKLKQELLAQKK